LLLACSGSLLAQAVSNLRATFTDCNAVITYDLSGVATPTDLTLWYSGDGGATWLQCSTVSGALLNQTTGANKTITWNNHADNVRYGRFAFKLELPAISVECVMINGVCWANRNLAAHGVFVDNPEDHVALFQWGRRGDGHEQRTSQNYTNGAVSDAANLDANGQIASGHAAYGKFITSSSSPYDWRSPQLPTLWNSGTETAPIKSPNDPCPSGWRMPTDTEFGSLTAGSVTKTWTTQSGVYGYRFTASGNTLFLPAAGYRSNNDGSLHDEGTSGNYWSSTVNGTYARGLDFDSGSVNASSGNRAYGFSCRCVPE
jgi:uncharacterized protein (TIGR02145 family)